MDEGTLNTKNKNKNKNKNMFIEIKCEKINKSIDDINFEYLSTPVVLKKSLEDINSFINETNNKYLN
jgi:hypothetical protein